MLLSTDSLINSFYIRITCHLYPHNTQLCIMVTTTTGMSMGMSMSMSMGMGTGTGTATRIHSSLMEYVRMGYDVVSALLILNFI